LPETLRIYRPGRVIGFGPRDRVAAGFGAAVEAARERGFGAVERLAGGRAAVFHEGTLALSWAIPDPDARAGIRPRFELLSDLVVDALRGLGIDARIGEVPGEYCPGEHSVNARGRTKLMGVGQRVVDGAAHVGGVIVVDGAEVIRETLVPVYRALEIDWDPETVGSLAAEVPGLTWDRARSALEAAFAKRFDLADGHVDDAVLAEAESLVARHAVVTAAERR
ncbi:MAG TPA: lipoate--protein ligase family protein, partial [Actinomycetota bacterium]|nr:lipoate--protein ligase family protein [Actinomycetota bacterium]